MKIAQIAPTWISVPPKASGGVETIISGLTEELVRRGHDVTLFASADSVTSAQLFSVINQAPGINQESLLNMNHDMKYLFNMFQALDKESEFDLIHWHFGKDISPIMFGALTKKPSIITIHNHFSDKDMSELSKILNYYKDFDNFVSISNSHREKFPFQYIATVYNGIDIAKYNFEKDSENYLVWLGRFVATKGPDLAIKVATKLNIPLKLAGIIEDEAYFKNEIEPYLDKNGIEYVGEVNLQQKNQLIGKAKTFINPIRWDEPFGLVVPESNACGTPIVSFARGSMPELIKDNINGYCIEPDNIDKMAESIQKIFDMSDENFLKLRTSSRNYAEDNFTISKMVDGYESVYQKVISK